MHLNFIDSILVKYYYSRPGFPDKDEWVGGFHHQQPGHFFSSGKCDMIDNGDV